MALGIMNLIPNPPGKIRGGEILVDGRDVLNLLQDLQEEHGLPYIFITHDLNVVRHISDDICVMYLGTVVEKCGAKTLFRDQRHPYTRALLSAIPIPKVGACRLRARFPPRSTRPTAAASHRAANTHANAACRACPSFARLNRATGAPAIWRMSFGEDWTFEHLYSIIKVYKGGGVR